MKTKLTIGMATRGEFNNVWFTLTGLTANHPKVEYLVVDNTPERCPRTESITVASGGRYLHRPDLSGTSKPRDAVFQYAETDFAMCIDSHVILESEAVAKAIEWCENNPNSKDLIQGPMVHDNGVGSSTHWTRATQVGLWGTWATDERGKSSELFEIPMMGLGLWMMRKDAWPGFNPLFQGFGGEEGYLHEVVRRGGGKCYCHPGIRWRHLMRDIGGWNRNPHPPYPLSLEDHTWNLLVGHRELGIEAEGEIFQHFGNRMPKSNWDEIVKKSKSKQVFGGPRPSKKRNRILAIWYTDNTAPEALLQKSIVSVSTAVKQTQRHDVVISACGWEPLASGFLSNFWTTYDGEKKRSHATIVKQIKRAVRAAILKQPDQRFDAVCFMEHDVLYPENYFDIVGDALSDNPLCPVVSHKNYIGLNGTGWQSVKERHEPLHQLTMRWNKYIENIERVEKEAADGRSVILEPDHEGDRSNWLRIEPPGPTNEVQMPSVHVNHQGKGKDRRFTGHGDVCYHPQGYTLFHIHWGEAKDYWPGEMTKVNEVKAQFKDTPPQGSCQSCEADNHNTLKDWFEAARAKPSDFHEHLDTLRELASRCDSATELSFWGKPADIAIAYGLPEGGKFTSISRSRKPQWRGLRAKMGDRFGEAIADANNVTIDECDLLFPDTDHTSEVLYKILENNHSRVKKYIVVHCTVTYGASGDKPNQPGVIHALRSFCKLHPEWTMIRNDKNNHGLIVLSKLEEDRKQIPAWWKKAMNFGAAMTKHVLSGRTVVNDKVLEERQDECALCEYRALEACSACGCPLEQKLPWASEQCGLIKLGLSPKWDAKTDPSDLRSS